MKVTVNGKVVFETEDGQKAILKAFQCVGKPKQPPWKNPVALIWADDANVVLGIVYADEEGAMILDVEVKKAKMRERLDNADP